MFFRRAASSLALLCVISSSLACTSAPKVPDELIVETPARDAAILEALAPIGQGFGAVAYLRPAAIDRLAERHDAASVFTPESLTGLEALENLDRTRLVGVGIMGVDNREIHAAAALGAPVGALEHAMFTHSRAHLPSTSPKALQRELLEQFTASGRMMPNPELSKELGVPPTTLYDGFEILVTRPGDDGLLVDFFTLVEKVSTADMAATIARRLAPPTPLPEVGGPALSHFLSAPGELGVHTSTFELAVVSRALEPARRLRYAPRDEVARSVPIELANEAESMRLLESLRRGGERSIVVSVSETLEVAVVAECFTSKCATPASSSLPGPGASDLFALRYVGDLLDRSGLPIDPGPIEASMLEGLSEEFSERPVVMSAFLSAPNLLVASVFEFLAPGLTEIWTESNASGLAMTYSAADLESTGATGFGVLAPVDKAGLVSDWMREIVDLEYDVDPEDELFTLGLDGELSTFVRGILAVHHEEVFGPPVDTPPGLTMYVDMTRVVPALEGLAPLFVGYANELDALSLTHTPSPTAHTYHLVSGARQERASALVAPRVPLTLAVDSPAAECFSEMPDVLSVSFDKEPDIEAIRAFIELETTQTSARLERSFECARERDPALADLVESAWLFRLASYHDMIREDDARDAELRRACALRRVPECVEIEPEAP